MSMPRAVYQILLQIPRKLIPHSEVEESLAIFDLAYVPNMMKPFLKYET